MQNLLRIFDSLVISFKCQVLLEKPLIKPCVDGLFSQVYLCVEKRN